MNFQLTINKFMSIKKNYLIQKKIKKDKLFFKTVLGKKKFFRNKSESHSKIFRRSIFVVKQIKKGETFTKHNIKKIRPGHGLPPFYYEKILGQKKFFRYKKKMNH